MPLPVRQVRGLFVVENFRISYQLTTTFGGQVHNVCLFRCDKCEVFFKSKKGFEGHVANRHAPKLVGNDGRPRTRKELEGLNKVQYNIGRIQAKFKIPD